MRQGSGNNITHRKDGFVADAVNPKAVAGIGINEARVSAKPPVVTSSVQHPPVCSVDTHKSGSQGRH